MTNTPIEYDVTLGPPGIGRAYEWTTEQREALTPGTKLYHFMGNAPADKDLPVFVEVVVLAKLSPVVVTDGRRSMLLHYVVVRWPFGSKRVKTYIECCNPDVRPFAELIR